MVLACQSLPKLVELRPSREATLSHSWFIALAIQIALWLETAVQLWADSLTRDGKAHIRSLPRSSPSWSGS